MPAQPLRPDIRTHFATLEDPRTKKCDHQLEDIIAITLMASICGADTWTDIAAFGRSKQDWLKTFLALPAGIPSHDTFGRVFALMNPARLQECFLSWVQAVHTATQGQVIAIDGKTARRSFRTKEPQSALHMVSAWACENQLVLGQVATAEKSNEITAIPELLKLLDIKGCLVTIDAMGCQKKIVEQIKNAGGDYVIGLKGNQEKLHEQAADLCQFLLREVHWPAQVVTSERGHGRKEKREYWLLDLPEEGAPFLPEWPSCRSFGQVKATRTVDGKTTTETRYYISSLQGEPQRFAQAVRQHWGIENSLHWCLDLSFREDECRVRKDHGPANLALLRRLTLSLLKQEQTNRCGIKNKRLCCGWNHDYLRKVLEGKRS